ncbi:MAG: hypothetical protein WCI92_09345 [Bacteroidota bacterium]
MVLRIKFNGIIAKDNPGSKQIGKAVTMVNEYFHAMFVADFTDNYFAGPESKGQKKWVKEQNTFCGYNCQLSISDFGFMRYDIRFSINDFGLRIADFGFMRYD